MTVHGPDRERRARRPAPRDRRGDGQEGSRRAAGRRLGDAEELEPPVQAQPRQDQDRRHLRARRGRSQPRAAREREGPLDRREADVHARQEDPRLRADVRARQGRGRGRELPRRAARRLGHQPDGEQPRRGARARCSADRGIARVRDASAMAVALVVAAGRGERLGAERPKALVELAGRPMLAWSIDGAARASTAIEQIVVALPRGRAQRRPGAIGVDGGERALGLGARGARGRAAPGDPVLVHDARAAAGHAAADRGGARGARRDQASTARSPRRRSPTRSSGPTRRAASSARRSTARGCGRCRRRRSSAAAALERALDVAAEVARRGDRRGLARRARAADA